jgi:hypothetical protein
VRRVSFPPGNFTKNCWLLYCSRAVSRSSFRGRSRCEGSHSTRTYPVHPQGHRQPEGVTRERQHEARPRIRSLGTASAHADAACSVSAANQSELGRFGKPFSSGDRPGA